jgi:nitrate reductase delta subunit
MTLRESELRTAHMVASVLLGYPDERLYDARQVLAEAVSTLPAGEVRERLTRFLDHAAGTARSDLAAHYVATFDLKRRCCPYLTYYSYGDTRKRGGALLRFKHALRAAGFELADGELPDHVAVVCELSARGAVREAHRLLQEHRAGLELLRTALADERSPYADVVAAVVATLPPAGRREQEAALRLAAEGPPAEEVGLEPYAVMEASR